MMMLSGDNWSIVDQGSAIVNATYRYGLPLPKVLEGTHHFLSQVW